MEGFRIIKMNRIKLKNTPFYELDAEKKEIIEEGLLTGEFYEIEDLSKNGLTLVASPYSKDFFLIKQ